MARIVDEMPSRWVDSTEAYPYDEWFDGEVWLLEAGADFQINPRSFLQAARAAAARRGKRLTVRNRPEGVYIQAVER